MASTVNGSASEGELGGLLTENDGRLSRDIFPKYKWRKVSAIRDFPPGCGRLAPQINLIQKTDVDSGDGIDNFVGADDTSALLRNDSISQSPRAAHSSGLTDTLGQINDLDSKQDKPTDQVNGLEPIGVEPVSQLPGALEVSNIGVKPVSQLRALEGSNDIILNGPPKVSELETSELLKSVLPDRPSDSPTLEGSNDIGLSCPLKVLELEATNLSENPPEVHIEEESIQSTSLNLTKDYPPPRKVFAVRSFPPFCGPNAPPLEEAEKKMRKHIQGGDAHKNKLEEDESTATCRDETAVEKVNYTGDLKKNIEKDFMVYQKKCHKRKAPDTSGSPELLREDCEGSEGASRRTIDKTEKSTKPSCDSNQYHRDETAVGKGEDLKKNTEEIVMYKKKILKRKVPDSSEQLREDVEGLEGSSRRMLVYGLRAAPDSEIQREKRGYMEKPKYEKSKLSGVKSAKKMNSPTQKIEWYDTEAPRKQCYGDTVVVEKDNMDVEGPPRNVGKEMVIYTERRSPEEKLSEDLEVVSDRVVVHALSAGGDSVGRQRKVPTKLNSGTSGNKGKKLALTYLDDSEHTVRRKSKKMVSPTIGTNDALHSTSHQLVVFNQDLSEDEEEINDFHVAVRSRKFDLCLPPFGKRGDERDGCVTRNKVRETLRLFQAVCRKLLQEEETRSKEHGTARKRIDLAAAKILRVKGKYVNTGPHILGPVPGVEVGDEFHYRVELNIIGLHRQIQGGIDYMKRDGEVLATSIVASGGYADELDNSDFLIYTGQGGNMMGGDKEPEDQKLERGNLALKTSILAKNPVRVIRGFKDTKPDSTDARGRQVVVMTYIYDGLYLVEKSWQEEGAHGKLVFKFRLARVPGQPELAWKQVKKSDKARVRDGLCDNDISQGKEIIPICAVNTIDDEKPPQFEYITHMIYPDWCRPIPPKGCDCTKKCSECTKCSCAILNGGEIPYNYNGAIVEAKPLVYECGPLCKCPPSCPNRVSQHGIRFQLEIFKTESRGWGVRSLNSISSGSYICEYAGELLEEKEADARTGNDEYLFDIGHNYSDPTLCGGLSTLMPEANSNSSEIVEDGFTIDAARYGNIGRFINHSCSPNLYAQNVLYDHEDKRVPHIMFFAAENIPPLQELTYHYNYTIDQVRDSNGNIKKKSCYCGAADCTGRMY